VRGDRLSKLLDFEGLKLAAGVTVLAPFVPLLFMGEEYGEKAPFQYFTSHSDADLIEAVRKGRKEEFSAFAWEGEIPDPHDEKTFLSSKLNHELKTSEPHRTLRAFHRELLGIRREYRLAGKGKLEIFESGSAITMLAASGAKMLAAIFEFGKTERVIKDLKLPAGTWNLRLNSADEKWKGPGNFVPEKIQVIDSLALKFVAQSFVLLERLNTTSE